MTDTLAFAPPGTRSPSLRQTVFRARFRANFKIVLAIALLGAGGYAVVSGHGYVVSDSAVVSTYTLSLRTPISGYVSGLRVRVGDTVTAGTVLARIDEPRVDDQRLIDLEAQLARIGANHAAYEEERSQLSRRLAALLERAAERNRLQSNFLLLRADEAERQLRAKETERGYALQEFGRKSALGRSGSTAIAEVDKARTAADQAAHGVDAEKLRYAYLRLQAEAARQGMLLESGSADVSYSSQRADEISIRLAGIDREIAFLSAARAETDGRLEAERRRLALLRGVDLVAPAAGMVWKLGASEGERLAVGDTAAEMVDCRSSFVLASIPRDRFPDIDTGANARVRLSGETVERLAHIASLTGEAALTGDRNLAVAPSGQSVASATARIEIAEVGGAGTDCLVGRTARVLLPVSSSGGLLVRLARRLF